MNSVKFFAQRFSIEKKLLMLHVCYWLYDSKLQNDISSLLKWAETWQMRFNYKKCHILSISRHRNKSSPVYYLETDVLSTVISHTYLGITVSTNLKWHEHISNICLKATRTLNFVRRNTYCCSQEAKNLA